MDLSKFKNIKSPYVLVLVGPPLVGKGVFCNFFKKNIDENIVIVSRDETVMDVYGSRNYTDAFNNVNQRAVDEELTKRLVNAGNGDKNVILDMTHMTSKRRRQNLNYFGDEFYKVAVIFPIPTDEEFAKRNKKRVEEENKDLPMHIVKRMLASYQPINREVEDFNKVISV